MDWYTIQYLYSNAMELFCSTMFPNVGVPSISVLEYYDNKKLYNFFDKQGIFLTIEMYTKNNNELDAQDYIQIEGDIEQYA